jgi:hypothetical protein
VDLTLDASKIIRGTQQTDFLPNATTTFFQQLASSANEAWEKQSASAPGDPTNFQIPAEPPLMMPPLSTKQLDLSASIIPTKGWSLGPWPSWSKQKFPRLAPKPDPLIYDHLLLPCLFPCLIISLLEKYLSNFQLLN